MNKKIYTVFKSILFASFPIGILLWIRSEYEKNRLTTAYYKIKTLKKLGSRKRIAFLTDLHDKRFGKNQEELLRQINTYSPDMILIGGDMPLVKKNPNLKYTMDLCRKLAKNYPVFYGNGNHELRLKDREKYGNRYKELSYALRNMGIRHLADSSAIYMKEHFFHKGKLKNLSLSALQEKTDEVRIRISGLDIGSEYYRKFPFKKMNSSFLKDRLGSSSKEFYEILLAHSPQYLKAYADWGADLVLSGHFHGGTIRLPGEVGLMTPQFQFFNRFVHGFKIKKNCILIISAGLGTHSVKVRLNNKPELVIVDLFPAD